ncbi:MAG: GNAT family N-acetyltransferase [Eubacterium sp.]|nr:GNAT family N-acetyltransferase [Eubacterium sp.]
MQVRRAESDDIPAVKKLLSQVLEVHAKIRPDIFIPGTTKYTTEELEAIFADEKTPVFVAVGEDGQIKGHAFCVITRQPFSTNMKDFTTLYIDDICVDEGARGQHVGTALYDHVINFAKELGCYDVTLNVWEGNDAARSFYERMGMGIKETMMEVIL